MLRSILTLSLGSMMAGTLSAGTLVPNTQPLTTAVQKEPVDTAVPIYRAYITAGNDKFAFIVPDQFRMGGDPAHGRLQLENAAAGSTITFTLLRSSDDDVAETGREAYRDVLTRRYPGAKFLGEFSQPAVGHNGLGFNVQWKSESGLVQQTRAFYVPTVAGLLELTVTTSTNNSKRGEANLSELLSSFQTSMNGELKVHHVGRTN